MGQKLSTTGGYSMGQAQAIISEIRQLQQYLTSGQKERTELVQVSDYFYTPKSVHPVD